ncbi:ApeA N-terminal domain 1-containing protein [Streptomyces sp. NPDC002426]
MAARRSIAFGESITGMLIDGIDDTPYVAATLHLQETTGVQIEVPYIDIPGTSQFDGTAQWFESEQPPRNLLLTSLEGDISLFDCDYSGHTVNYPRGVGLGKVMPSSLVLHRRDGDFDAPLKVKELRSHIDGLIEWTHFGAIKRTSDTDDKNLVKKVIIEVSSLNETTWRQGAANMRLGSDWNLNPAPNSVTVNETVSLTSSFEEPQSIGVHLEEHRKVAALLSFIFGCAIYFRRHDVRDPQFSGKTLSGRVVESPFYQLISRSTVKEHAKPGPPRAGLDRPLAEFKTLDSKGLEQWAREYDKWDRFIHPAISALNRPGAILENLVVNAAMSMEAAGSLLGQVSGEAVTCRGSGKPTTATYMYRCLIEAGWDWSAVCKSIAGLARAIANNYNTIKHFDRGRFPDPTETYLVSSITALIVRMLAMRVARSDQSAADLFDQPIAEFERLKGEFRANGLIVDDTGSFVTR